MRISGLLGREKTYQMVSQKFGGPACIIPADCWKSMSLDFVFGLPADDRGNTGILVFVCRLSKMVHLAPVCDKVTGKQAAQLFLDSLTMSTADHPQTDGQTERVNCVLEYTLRSICAEALRSWSDQLPMVEFALNNAVHASTGFTPFYLNGLRPPGAANLAGRHRGLHRIWGRGSESLFLPGLRNSVRVFKKTVVVVYRQQADVDQPG
ncbi:Reverse transcriptase [Phytophthora palmivora]|uniref:Reverse transcriptase n=1 Tax=Phytophthora palmivora TaxID=4796 RepID=A0A2P4XIE4_9STRA|nr:Reverse transcriptase [Phytophthora palmivora]